MNVSYLLIMLTNTVICGVANVVLLQSCDSFDATPYTRMDVLSTYSILQYHREMLFMPYFTLEEFVAALQLRTPADRFLMTFICH